MTYKTNKEPDHSKFKYHQRDIDQWGAVKNCVCENCKKRRTNAK